MKIPIEDFCEDIVQKAMCGTRTTRPSVVEKAAISRASLDALLGGEGDEVTARAVAPLLGLSPGKLTDSLLARWYPESREMDGLFMTNTAYHDMFVNAYLIWDPSQQCGALFDTGSDASALIDQAQTLGLDIRQIFLTHTHRDHIMDLERVRKAFPSTEVFVGEREADAIAAAAQSVRPGDAYQLGGLTVSARLTWGHSDGGITYVIDGLSSPVAVVGDAMFAGSMGGGMVSYDDALRTNRDEILTLDDETILCPGHGPLTTVGEEKRHNPFF